VLIRAGPGYYLNYLTPWKTGGERGALWWCTFFCKAGEKGKRKKPTWIRIRIRETCIGYFSSAPVPSHLELSGNENARRNGRKTKVGYSEEEKSSFSR
jgi:hypothetical protein